MKLEQAQVVAERVKAALAPHCERIEIAGSIRRRKPEVGDIEIVCIPKTVFAPDLFGAPGFADEFKTSQRSCEWVRAAWLIGDVVMGRPVDGKYIKIRTAEGAQVDLFTATAENWGLIYAIRTGSADFSHNVLASGWVRQGYKSVDGMLTRGGSAVPTPEESDLFAAAGVTWTEPENRNL